MKHIALDAAAVEAEIVALLTDYPELAEDETLRADMLAGSTGAMEVLSAIVAQMQDAKTMAAAIKARAAEIRDRASRFERREGAMRVLAERIMRVADLRKAELPEATLSIRAVPPSVVITAEDELPEAFIRTVRSPDKAAIKDALKAGEFVPGAEMGNGGETLSVRVA